MTPVERFFGLSANASFTELLGLPPSEYDVAAIDYALKRRLALIYQHPDGRSQDAETVRALLRKAANSLKESLGQSGASVQHVGTPIQSATPHHLHASAPRMLTPFDHMVLSVLVGYGGWNAQSRSRLISLATNYGVTPAGLLRVIHGLNDYARFRGPHLETRDMVAVQPSFAQRGGAAAAVSSSALLDRIAEQLAKDLDRDDAWPTIRLAILFGVATIVLSVLVLRLIFFTGDTGKTDVSPDWRAVTTPALRTTDGTDVQTSQRTVPFIRYPTFLGDGLPVDAVRAADQTTTIVSALRNIQNAFESEIVNRSEVTAEWNQLIGLISTGWPLIDKTTRLEIHKSIIHCLRLSAEDLAISDDMLSVLNPPQALNEPVNLWRGSWMAGILGEVNNTTSILPVVIQRARSQLQVSLNELPNPMNFESAARAWLNQSAAELVRRNAMETSVFDDWELWLSAQRHLGIGDEYDLAIISAIDQVLRTELPANERSPSLKVLGRLVEITLSRSTEKVRVGYGAFFAQEEISSNNLWLLTCLLARSDKSAWFDDRMILPRDADDLHRRRIRDEIVRLWPDDASYSLETNEVRSRMVRIDEKVGRKLKHTTETALKQSLAPTQQGQMQQLILLSRLIEAAQELAFQHVIEADSTIKSVESQLDVAFETVHRSSKKQSTSAVPKADEVWAEEYSKIGRNTDQRLELLHSLRARSENDLGPRDAAVLVREVYRGAPREIRTIAQAVVVDNFTAGLNVATEMLDQFPDAPRTYAVSETIEHLTGSILPSSRSANWAGEARHALVRHVISLHPEGTSRVDVLANDLIDSYVRRLTLLRGDTTAFASPLSPQDAAKLLLEAWRDTAAVSITASPVPDNLSNLHNRQTIRFELARGPIHQFIASQLGILDYLTYVTAAELPFRRDDARQVLAKYVHLHSRSDNELAQALLTERAVAEMWMLRLGLHSLDSESNSERRRSQ